MAKAGPSRWVGPVSGDSSPVPSKQRVGCDDPSLPESAGERGGDRTQQRSVVVVESGPFDLAVKHGELMSKHDDLGVLGAA